MFALIALGVAVAASPCRRPIMYGKPTRPCPQQQVVTVPTPEQTGASEPLTPPPLIEPEAVSAPPLVTLDETTELRLDRAELELAAAKKRSERARREAKLPVMPPDEEPEAQTNVGPDADRGVELLEPVQRRNPLATDHHRAAVRKSIDDEWAREVDRSSFGPTGAIYVGVSLTDAATTSGGSGAFGGMLGVRFFPKDAPAAGLSVLVSGEIGSRGIELGLPLRAELIGMKEGAQVPSVRLGAMLTPFLALGQSGAPNLAGGRASLTLGWCLPAAVARGPDDPLPEGGGISGGDLRVLNALSGLGNGGAALLVLLAALVVMTPDLTLGYEVSSEAAGFTRSMVHFSIGVGI
jgi:hypothetical protein